MWSSFLKQVMSGWTRPQFQINQLFITSFRATDLTCQYFEFLLIVRNLIKIVFLMSTAFLCMQLPLQLYDKPAIISLFVDLHNHTTDTSQSPLSDLKYSKLYTAKKLLRIYYEGVLLYRTWERHTIFRFLNNAFGLLLIY